MSAEEIKIEPHRQISIAVSEQTDLIQQSDIKKEQGSEENIFSNNSSSTEELAKIYKDLNAKIKENKQMDLPTFFKQSQHYFIMTDGGKPVFSRYGDEVENCGILATFSAMMTKFTCFNSGNSQTVEKLHYISTEKTLTVFLKKGKLIFIALSKNKDSISFLNSHLEYLYIQLLSIISADRIARLESNPSYCMSAMSDTEVIFEQIINYSTHSLISLLNSFHVLVLDSNMRNRLSSICNENKGEALLSILLTPYEIITICRSEVISLVAHDIILIQNLLFSSESLRLTESFVPICLPGISDAGYLQLYCKFFEPNMGLVFITESQDTSLFLKFSEQSQNIYETLMKENLLDALKLAIENSSKFKKKSTKNEGEKLIQDFFFKLSVKSGSLPHLERSNSISGKLTLNNNTLDSTKYVICKHKDLSQLFTVNFAHFDALSQEEIQVLKNYTNLYDIFNSQILPMNSQNFFHYEKDGDMTHIIHVNETLILFASFSIFKDFGEINNLCLEFMKTIKYKDSHFFICKY